jgi:hypothetical protein
MGFFVPHYRLFYDFAAQNNFVAQPITIKRKMHDSQ